MTRPPFAPIAHLTVGDFRDWLLSDLADTKTLARIARGVTPEMAAAVSKIMRNQDLILVARKCSVVTRFRNTIGLPGTMAVRLQPNHPTDDLDGIAATTVEGLLYGCGDAVIGVNPASDSPAVLGRICHLFAELIERHDIPTQACVLTHATTTIELVERGVPVDLVFQSIAGTEAANASFGVTLALLREAQDAVYRRSAARSARTSCISRRARARPCLPAPIMASTSRRSRLVPMRWRAPIGRCLSTRSWASSAPNISTTGSRSSGPGSRTISAAS